MSPYYLCDRAETSRSAPNPTTAYYAGQSIRSASASCPSAISLLRSIGRYPPSDWTPSRRELLDQVLDEELPRFAEALRRLGE